MSYLICKTERKTVVYIVLDASTDVYKEVILYEKSPRNRRSVFSTTKL